MAAATSTKQKAMAIALGTLLLGAAIVPGAAQTPARKAPGYALKEPTTPEEIAAAKPNPQAPGFRIPLPPLDQMDSAMRADFESNAKRLKTPVPTVAPLMLTPEIKAGLSGLSSSVSKVPLPQDVTEITILMVARQWDAQFEWWVHAPQAVIVGVPADAVEAIRMGKTPASFANPGQEATYRYLMELYRDHKVTDATYERLRAIIGTRETVAMTVLAGYYSIVAMDLIAHNVPFRSDVKPPLPKLASAFPAK